MTGRALGAALATMLLTSCANPTNLGSHDAAPQRDALVPCGAASCSGGTVCCNASCGICVLPGESCSPTACSGPTLPQLIPCGMNTCNSGQVCCNPSCGVCTLPGEKCSPEPCGG